MEFKDLERAGWGEAARAWKEHWTEWVRKNLSEEDLIDWDPDRPWIQVFGETPVLFRLVRGALRAVRDPEWGYDRVDFRWDGTGWTDVFNG